MSGQRDEQDDPADAALLRDAGWGDQRAWSLLVRRHSRVVWAVARQYRLDHADAADVCQNTWLTLAVSLHDIREPRRLNYWLATTTAREARRVHAKRRREIPEPEWDPLPSVDGSPEFVLLTAERDCLLWQAFSGLPEHCRSLLRLLAHAPELSYAQAATVLGIPANSIGPRRGRCLVALRRKVAAVGILEEAV